MLQHVNGDLTGKHGHAVDRAAAVDRVHRTVKHTHVQQLFHRGDVPDVLQHRLFDDIGDPAFIRKVLEHIIRGRRATIPLTQDLLELGKLRIAELPDKAGDVGCGDVAILRQLCAAQKDGIADVAEDLFHDGLFLFRQVRLLHLFC